jgi:hypothetical protein
VCKGFRTRAKADHVPRITTHCRRPLLPQGSTITEIVFSFRKTSTGGSSLGYDT